MRTMMSTMRATMEAPTPTPTWASIGNVDWAWLSYWTLPREKFRFPIFTWETQIQTFLNHKGEKKHFRIQSFTFVAPHWCTLKSLFSILLTRVLEYSPVMLNVNVNRLSVTSTHCEFRQTVHAILFAAGCDWRLLVRWFTVQVAVGEGLHWTHPLPYPSLHLMLVDGQIKVLSLERNDTKWCAA